MNGKTATLLRKVSEKLGTSVEQTKKLWNDTPKDKRGKLRLNLLKELSEE